MRDYAQTAHENFKSGYNCAQAVACTFAKELNMREEDVARMVSCFGGGMGKLRQVCGAVSGALFVLGSLKGYSDPTAVKEKADLYAHVQDFAARFRAEHETLVCRELLKNLALKNEQTSAPDARTEDYYRVRPCVRFVESAARIVDEMLNDPTLWNENTGNDA